MRGRNMFLVRIRKDFTDIQSGKEEGLNLTVVFEHVKKPSVKFNHVH